MLKVLLFVSFLLAYGGWTLMCAKTLKKVQTDLLSGKSFMGSELMLIEGIAGFFGFIYVLSGMWSLKLVLLIFIVSHLGALVAWLMSSILGSQSEKVGIRTLSAGREIDIRYPVPMAILGGGCGLLVLSYPVFAGVAFFRHTWGSSVLQILQVKYALLLLNLSGYVLLVIVTGMMLSSENLDEETRQRVFINQLGGLIPAAIYVALALWAFGVGGTRLSVNMLGLPDRTLSLPTLGLLLGFFVVTVLLPYIVGTQRALRKRQDLPQIVRSYVSELADILETPAASTYIAKLGALQQRIGDAQDQFVEKDGWLSYEKKLKGRTDEISDQDKSLADVIAKTRSLDPRFKFLDDLSQLRSEVEEIIADLQQRSQATVEDAADHWSKKYEIRKADLSKTIDATSTRKPLITGGLGALAMMLVSALLSEVSKTAWQWISHAAK